MTGEEALAEIARLEGVVAHLRRGGSIAPPLTPPAKPSPTWGELYLRAIRGDVDAADLLPMSEWAEARRSTMTPRTIAENALLHRRGTDPRREQE